MDGWMADDEGMTGVEASAWMSSIRLGRRCLVSRVELPSSDQVAQAEKPSPSYNLEQNSSTSSNPSFPNCYATPIPLTH
jgi:hypothetical protein